MAITTLDKATALIVVDLQKGIVSMPSAHSVADVVRNSAAMAKAFRAHGLPVVLVNVAGMAPGRSEGPRGLPELPAEWFELMPELDRQANDHVVTKKTWGAFTNTGLADYLKSKSVTQVVVCGVATSIGVESTARQAHELGLNVTLATDAMGDRSAEAHDNSIARIFPRLGETGTTQAIVEMLAASRS